MKILLRCSLVTLLFIAVLASSCTKRHIEGGAADHYLLATSTSAIGSFHASGTSLTTTGSVGAKLSISGTTSGGANLTIWMNVYTGRIGTYSLNNIDAGADYFAPPTFTSQFRAEHGTLTITAVSPNIAGIYSYYANADSVLVTGSFNVATP